MLIRTITSADAAAYFQLRVQSEHELPQFVGFSVERELSAGASGMVELLGAYPSEGTHVLGAFVKGGLIAVVALSRRLSPKYRHKALLWGMYVAPEFRGDNVAHLLMEAVIGWANAQPEIIALWLQVTLSNLRGQRFYQRYGFSVFGTEQRSLFAAGEYHGVHYMELELSHAQQVLQAGVPAFGGSAA